APLDYALRSGSVNEAAVALVEAGARLTPCRLETMHAAAHRPDSDVLQFPWASEREPSGSHNQGASVPSSAAKASSNAASGAGMPVEFKCPECHYPIYSRKP